MNNKSLQRLVIQGPLVFFHIGNPDSFTQGHAINDLIHKFIRGLGTGL